MADNNNNDNDVRETITIPEHGSADDIRQSLVQIAKVANALAGRVLIGGAFGGAGAAHPIVQSIYQCAAGAGNAVALIEQADQQRRSVLVPSMQPPRMGRA